MSEKNKQKWQFFKNCCMFIVLLYFSKVLLDPEVWVRKMWFPVLAGKNSENFPSHINKWTIAINVEYNIETSNISGIVDWLFLNLKKKKTFSALQITFWGLSKPPEPLYNTAMVWFSCWFCTRLLLWFKATYPNQNVTFVNAIFSSVAPSVLL